MIKEDLQEVSRKAAIEKINGCIYEEAKEGKGEAFFPIRSEKFRNEIRIEIEELETEQGVEPSQQLDISEHIIWDEKGNFKEIGLLVSWW